MVQSGLTSAPKQPPVSSASALTSAKAPVFVSTSPTLLGLMMELNRRGGAVRQVGDELGGAVRLVEHHPGAAALDQLDPGVGQDGGQAAGVLDREELVVGRPGQQGGPGER